MANNNNQRSSHYHPSTKNPNVQSEFDEGEEDFNDISYSSSIISNISNLLGNSSCFLTNAREFAERGELAKDGNDNKSYQNRAEEEIPKFNLRELLKNTPTSKPSTVVRPAAAEVYDTEDSFNLSDLSLTSANSFNQSRKGHKQSLLPSILERSNEDSTKSPNGVRTTKSSFNLSNSSIISPNSTISVPDMDSMVARVLAPENLEKFRRSLEKHGQMSIFDYNQNQPKEQANPFDDSVDFKRPIMNSSKNGIRRGSSSSKSSSTSSSTKNNRVNTPDSWGKFDAQLGQSLAQIKPEEIAFGSFTDADRLSVSDSEFQNLTSHQKNEFLNNDRKEELYILNPVADSFSKTPGSQSLNQSKLNTPLSAKEISMGKYFIRKSMKPWESSIDMEDDLDETIKSEIPTKENVEPKQEFDTKRFSRDSAIVSAQTTLKDKFSVSNLLDESFFNSSRTNNQEKYSKFSNDLKRSMEIDNRGSTPLSNKFKAKAKKQSPVNFPDNNSSFASHITRSITRSQPVKIHPKKTVSTSTSTSMIQTINQQQHQQFQQPQLQFQHAVPSTSNANQNQMTFQGTPQVVQASAYQMNPPNMQNPFYGLPIIIQIQCPMMQAHQQPFQQQQQPQQHPSMNFTNNN